MKVVILGAGSSAGTVEAPIARNFGKALAKCVPNWRELFPNLALAVNDWAQLVDADPDQGWPLDGVWTLVDNYSKLFPILRSLDVEEYESGASTDLRRAVLEVYGQTCVGRLPAEPAGTLARVLGDVKPGDVIISMNYDTVVEEIAQRRQIPVAIADPHNPGPDEGRVTLVKPHGSVSWRQWVPERGRYIEMGREPMAPGEVREEAGDTIQPLLVGLVPFKSDIIAAEIMKQNDTNDAYGVLAHQWGVACQALRDVAEVIVVGYGFPSEDLHARFLFREARRAPASQRCRITLYERPERRVAVSAAIYEIFGGREKPVEIDFRGPVQP